MSLDDTLAKDRRRLILECLAAADGLSLAAGVLETMVTDARKRAWRDVVQADIVLLAQHRLVSVEELPSAAGPQREVTLTGRGRDVAYGRAHPLIAARQPAY